MNIAVVAANGRSGKAFVLEALAAGHIVRAGVRGKDTLTPHPNLTVVRCDATSAEDINGLIKHQEVVASFIGHGKDSPAHLQTDVMKVLHIAMRANGVKRCVSLTGTGVRLPGDKITAIDRVLNAVVRIVDPVRVQDGKDHLSYLQQTELDWTVVRVLKLQNIPPSPFRLSKNGPTKMVVGRREVARAILQIIDQNSFVRQAPMISKRLQG